jgi:hypothetical protein
MCPFINVFNLKAFIDFYVTYLLISCEKVVFYKKAHSAVNLPLLRQILFQNKKQEPFSITFGRISEQNNCSDSADIREINRRIWPIIDRNAGEITKFVPINGVEQGINSRLTVSMRIKFQSSCT